MICTKWFNSELNTKLTNKRKTSTSNQITKVGSNNPKYMQRPLHIYKNINPFLMAIFTHVH